MRATPTLVPTLAWFAQNNLFAMQKRRDIADKRLFELKFSDTPLPVSPAITRGSVPCNVRVAPPSSSQHHRSFSSATHFLFIVKPGPSTNNGPTVPCWTPEATEPASGRSRHPPSPIQIWQEAGKQSDRRQERAKLIHKINSGMVRQLAQKRRADSAQPESHPKE